MKIAWVVPGGVDRSGEYRVIPALLSLLKRQALKHEVHVFALRQEAVPGQWMLHGAHIHNVGRGRTVPRALTALLREHRAAPFDVVQSLWSGHCGLLAVTGAKLMGRPSAVHIGGGELVALPAIGYGGRLTWRGRLCEALVLRGASAITAASEPVVAQLAGLGLTGRRIPLGVDLQAWPPRPPQRRASGQPLRLIHVASLNEVKDQRTLLLAMAILAGSGVDFYLDIVGEDTLGGTVQALSCQLGLDRRTSFHGFMTQAHLRPLLERSHIMLMSSLHETGPLVVLEAAVLGVPCVGTAVGHLKEWAGEAALAVPVGDAPALATAVARLAADEALRMQLAAQAQARAVAHDAYYTATLFEQLYAELSRIHEG